MSARYQIAILAVMLLFATILQGRIAHALDVHGAQSDFPLIVLACGASLVGGGASVYLGLWAGLLTASLVGVDYGSYLASRTVAGAFAGWLTKLMIRDSVIAPPLVVLAVTVIAETVYVLMAPIHYLRTWPLIRHWLHGFAGELAYNAVFAFPIYLLMRRWKIGEASKDPFA